MAKKTTQPIIRTKIFSKEFTGYLDEMTQEAKDALVARNPKAEKLFEKCVAPTPTIEE